MNDHFVYRVLPEVPADFARSLYARIAQEPPAPARPRQFLWFSSLPQKQLGAIALGLVLVVAWTQVLLRIRYVAIGDLLLVEIGRLTESAPAGLPAPLVPTPGQLPSIDGRWVWRFGYVSPSWVPEGFSPAEPPSEMRAYEMTMGLWVNGARQTIRLFAVPQAGGMHPYAPPETYKEVRIKDRPAILIHGRYAPTSLEDPQAERLWDDSLGLQLYWPEGGTVFGLETFGAYVAASDLIRMAESMETVQEFGPMPWSVP
jgi:hypothetical protein